MAEGSQQSKRASERAPTLYAIVAYKLAKGILFASLALALYTLSDNNLPVDYQNTLEKLNHHLRFFNPEKRFWIELASKVDAVTEPMMVHAAIGTFFYSLFSLVEGTGLMLRIRWVGWMTIGETAFFIPIEVFEMLHKFSWLVLLITIGNILILWYLLQNRERLFHHHHRREPKPPDKPPVEEAHH